MQEGWSTAPDNVRSLGFGAGMGLPNMKKYTDEMKIDSTVGVGTTAHHGGKPGIGRTPTFLRGASPMEEYVHSVTLNPDACQGCITCVKRCPTEAIRVRGGQGPRS